MTRFLVGVPVLLVLAGAAALLLQKPVVEMTAHRVLAGAGLAHPSAEFGSISLTRLSFKKVTAGADPKSPDVALENVVLDYQWRDFFFGAKTEKISAGSGRVRATLSEAGRFSVAGWTLNPGAAPKPPPYSALSLGKIDFVLATPKGDLGGEATGAMTLGEGGKFTMSARAADAGFAALALQNARIDAEMTLDRDGRLRISGAYAGDVATSQGVARGVKSEFSGDVEDWRNYFKTGALKFTGEAGLKIDTAAIAASEAPALAPFIAAGAPSIRAMTISGDFVASLHDGDIEIREGSAPLLIRADRGDALTLSSVGVPLFQRKADAEKIDFAVALSGPGAVGKALISALSQDGKAWDVKARADLGEQTIAGVKIAGLSGNFAGRYAGETLAGAAEVNTHLRRAVVGRLSISDMPARARLSVNADFAAKSLSIGASDGACVDVDRVHFDIPSQDMDARIDLGVLCGGAAPLARIDFGEAMHAHMQGTLSARSLNYRLGRTVLNGAPPRMNFILDYDPAAEASEVSGSIEGGDAVLSDTFRLSGAKGDFKGSFVGEKLVAEAALSEMRIAQAVKSPVVAPVSVAGDARLRDDHASFDFNVSTPKGVRLGDGEGTHDVSTGKGSAVFRATGLTFAKRGLQPDQLIPAFKGALVDATGSATGEAQFGWTPAGVTSSATIALDKIGFGGPVRALTRTEGVTGTLTFSNLSPAATNGEQTLKIGRMAIDALELENGSMTFLMPGDETLIIPQAEFPWFGGTMGVYGAKLSLAGTTAETKFQIDNVNLKSLLDKLAIDGLSGEGTIEGVMPISFKDGRSYINNGVLSAKGGGIIRYTGQASDASAQAGGQAQIAFEALRELRFDTLSAVINGPLDGRLDFRIFFEGRSLIPVQAGREIQRVDSPVKYRVSIDAPLLSLLQQAALSTNVRVQFERARSGAATERKANEAN